MRTKETIITDDDINKEFLDYEPRRPKTDTRHTASTDDAPSGWPVRGGGYADAAASNGPKQLRRASGRIANTLDDIAAGRASGEYPAVESIIRGRQHGPDDICTPDCEFRQPAGSRTYESAVAKTRVRIIDDVRPPLPERVAVLEHIVHDIDKTFDRHQEESIRAGATYATKSQVQGVLDYVNGPIEKRILRLENSQGLRNWLWGLSLTTSAILNVVFIYMHFSQ